MKYYAVIDTNVLVSSLLSRHDDSATVLLVGKMLAGELIPVYSTEILIEYRNVLSRTKFGFDRALTDTLLSAIEYFGLMTEPTETGTVLPDMKDLPFYEVVMEKRRDDDAYLVTGNLKHFPSASYIVTPNEMLNIMDGRLPR